MPGLGDLWWTIRGDTGQLDKDIDGSIAQAAGRLEQRGAALTKGVTLPLLGFAAAGSKAFADVNTGLREVVSLTGQAGAEADATFAKFRTQVEDLSGSLGVAQTELVDGLYSSLSAGVPESNVFSFLETATKAGIAGVATTEQAVDGITSAINAFGLGFDEANRVADVFFSTVKNGKTTLPEISQVIGRIAPAANLAGVSLEEVGAAISTLTANGVQTTEAATQIKAALDAVTSPAEKVINVFRDFGFESGQAAIEQVGLQGALEVLFESADGNVGVLKELLGTQEAVGATAIIAGSGAQKFATDLDSAANSAGAATRAFDQIDEARNLERTINDFKNLAISIGESLQPALEGVAAAGEVLAAVLDAIPDSVLTTIGGIAAAAGPAAIAMAKLAKATQSFGQAGTLSGSITSAAARIGTLGPAAGAAAAGFGLAAGAAIVAVQELDRAKSRADAYGAAIDAATGRNLDFSVILGNTNDELERQADAIAAIVTAEGQGLAAVFSELGRDDVLAQLEGLGVGADELAAFSAQYRDTIVGINAGFAADSTPVVGGLLGALGVDGQAFDEGADSVIAKFQEIADTAPDEEIRRVAETLVALGQNLPEQEFFALIEGLDDVGAAAERDADRANGVAQAFLDLAVARGELSQSQVDTAIAAARETEALDFIAVAAQRLVTQREILLTQEERLRAGLGGSTTSMNEAAAAADQLTGRLSVLAAEADNDYYAAQREGLQLFQTQLADIAGQLETALAGSLDIDTEDGINDVQNAIDNIKGAVDGAGESLQVLEDRVAAITELEGLGEELGVSFENLIGQIAAGAGDGLLDDILYGEGGTTPELLADLEAQLAGADALNADLALKVPDENLEALETAMIASYTSAAEAGLAGIGEVFAASPPEISPEVDTDPAKSAADEIVEYYLEQNPTLTVTVNYVEGFGIQFDAPEGFSPPVDPFPVIPRNIGGTLPPDALVSINEGRPELLRTDEFGRGFVFPGTDIVSLGDQQTQSVGVAGDVIINEAESPGSAADELIAALYMQGY